MDERQDCVQQVGLNGLRQGERAGSIFQVLDDRRWSIAEERAAELIACIQPTETSEQHRLAVAHYVQKIIMQCVQCQVFMFGSVPLRTYLPDGDIDLTTFGCTPDLNYSLPNKVRNMLLSEENNKNAKFRVQEVQFINAEVKIVKCLVENIVVDISFNQTGGICTLCFLEEVDQIIGHDHLFKRSIILIKAWCYYESRILGAHHGLISTYALETLVLYIFHVFNDSFKGPLEVLYRFLDFFSKFDWEKYCVSLWGPVPLGSLPEIIAEPPRKDCRRLLLEKAFLEKCTQSYGYNSEQEQNCTLFPKRSLNVVDPLRFNNNLGRSVSKGNFFRIRSAFAFGAVKLARLLDCPEENLYVEVNQFFSNTWQRHGHRIRPDAPFKVPKFIRPPTPDTPEGNVEEIKESSNFEARNASTGRHDNASKGHARQISSGTNSQNTRNHSSFGIADVVPGLLNASFSSDLHSSFSSASDNAANSEVSSSSYQNIRVDNHTFRNASKENFYEDEQDRIKMMTPSMFHGFNGHFPFPLNMPSGHVPFAVPPSVLASLNSHQKNMEGMFQRNIPSVENPWAMTMQFAAVPPSTAHYFHNIEMSEMNKGVKPADLTLLDFMNKVWYDQDGNSYKGFDFENGTSEVPFDDRPSSVAGKHESFRINAFDHQYLNNVKNEAEEAVTLMNLLPAEVYSSTLRSKISGSSSDGKYGMVLSVTEERRGRNTIPSDTESADYEIAKIVSEHFSTQLHDDEYGKDGKTTALRNSIDRNEPQSHQLPCVGLPSKIGIETGADRVSEEIVTDNPGVAPFRFIPAGPPVPFLTMLNLYSVPNKTGTGTKSNIQIAECEEPGRAECRRWDAFDSNLLAHLQILMYAHSCQATQNNQRLGLPSQFTHPPAYCVPSGCSVRSLPPNINQFTPFTGSDGNYIPVAPSVTHMPIRPPTDYQPRVEEMPRYRGTGTYFPNPIQKNNVRDRKISGNGRANDSYSRNDQHSDKGGNWNHSKPRVAGRNHIQNQYDKGRSRIPRSATGEIGNEKSWGGGSNRRPGIECPSSHEIHTAVEYDIYSLPACSVKGRTQSLCSVPPLMMMCPYGQKVGYSPQPQVLEFGSLGPVDLPGMKGYSLAKDAYRPTLVPEDLHR